MQTDWRIERDNDLWVKILSGHGMNGRMIADCLTEQDAALTVRAVTCHRDLIAALEHWIARTLLLSGRWPCPECDRASLDVKKQSIQHSDGSLHGCWLCNTENLREETAAALAEVKEVTEQLQTQIDEGIARRS